jgi:regulatory protein
VTTSRSCGSREEHGKRARDRALFYLGVKERSCREVQQWLRRKGYREEEIVEAIEDLRGHGLLDDLRLAEMITRRALLRGWGRTRALAEMESRGIDRETAESALNGEYVDDEAEVAMKAALARWEKMGGEAAVRERKLISWMARMGYSTSTVIRVLERIRGQPGGDPFP